MKALLALLAVVVPASVTLVGYWFKRQSEKRLDQEHRDELVRLRLDAAMRAAELFGSDGGEGENPAKSASALIALTRLENADLAAALPYSDFMQGQQLVRFSDLETAAAGASPNPDGYLERLVSERASRLDAWATRCGSCAFHAGVLSTAAYQWE